MNAREAREMSGQPKDDEIQQVYDIIKRSIAIGNPYRNVKMLLEDAVDEIKADIHEFYEIEYYSFKQQ